MDTRDNIRAQIVRLVELEGSRTKFAKRIGVTPQNVYNWIHGNKCPDIERLAQIAKTYSVSIDSFFNAADESSAPCRVVNFLGNEVEDSNLDMLVSMYRQMNEEGRAHLMMCARTAMASGMFKRTQK